MWIKECMYEKCVLDIPGQIVMPSEGAKCAHGLWLHLIVLNTSAVWGRCPEQSNGSIQGELKVYIYAMLICQHESIAKHISMKWVKICMMGDGGPKSLL